MRGFVPFLGQRLFRALIALWLVSTVVFVVMRLSGDPVPLLLPPDAPTSEILRVRHELGLDQPLPVQYAIFLGNLAHGDFGRSIHFREPAFNVVRGYLAATLELGLTAFVLAAVVAVPIGLFSAMQRNTLVDHVAMGLALIGQSAPTFFLGILFILLLSLKADLFPTSGRGDWTQPRAARAHPRRLHDGLDRAADALRGARGAARRLHPHRAGQGRRGDVGGGQAHPQERGDPDRDHHRAPVRHAAGRRGGDRDGLRVAGHRHGSPSSPSTIATIRWCSARCSSPP